ITDRIKRRRKSTVRFHDQFEFSQEDYHNQDFQYAFGAIDKLDIEADFIERTIKVWFLDCYEWHPIYPQILPKCDGSTRQTNFLHAALVQLKREGAEDYWMRGEATFPFSVFPDIA